MVFIEIFKSCLAFLFLDLKTMYLVFVALRNVQQFAILLHLKSIIPIPTICLLKYILYSDN